MVKTIIKGGTIITMDPSRRIINEGAVVIEKEKIVDVGLKSDIDSKYKADYEIDASHHIILPGFFDAHGHAGHSLVKSLGMHTEKWSQACEVIYSQSSTKEFWEADALLTNLERLKFGTTCGVTFMGGGDSVMRLDHPKFAEKHCEAVKDIGVRTFLAIGPRRPPYPRKYSRWSGDARRDYMVSFEEIVQNCRQIIKKYQGANEGRINIAMMLPVPNPTRKPIIGAELSDLKYQSRTCYELAQENSLLFTMDGHSRGTIKFCHEELGLTGSNSLFSHSTELTPEEIDICAKTSTSIAHNPSAVASILGRCPVPELLDAGVKVALGSDAAAPDRSYDMFRHMFQAMRYHRRYYRDAQVLPPGKVLEMVTIDSANALGLGHQLGSIEPGKLADLITVDMHKPHLYPRNMPVDRITYYANGNDVDTVIVNGEILMEKRKLRNIDEDKIFDMANNELETAVKRSKIDGLFDTSDNYWGKSHY